MARADWTELSLFALTFNGYEYCGSFKAAAAIANARASNTPSELRTCLFVEQRRVHHSGDQPDIEYCRGLVEQIRAKVVAGFIE